MCKSNEIKGNKQNIKIAYFFCECGENKNVLDKRRVIPALWEGFKKLMYRTIILVERIYY